MTDARQIEPCKSEGKRLDMLRWDLEARGDSFLQRLNQESSGDNYTFRIYTATDEINYGGQLSTILNRVDKKLFLENLFEEVQRINFELSRGYRSNGPRITAEIDLANQVMRTEQVDGGNSTQCISSKTRDDFLSLANDIAGYYLARVSEQRTYDCGGSEL